MCAALVVFAHELPQEVGDIGILLHSGMGRIRALVLNLLVSVAAGIVSGVSSSVVALSSTATGGSFTGLTVIATVSVSVNGPPLPVLPRSSVLSVSVTLVLGTSRLLK